MNKQLPYLVGNVVEILDLKPEVCQTGRVNTSPDRSERRAGTPSTLRQIWLRSPKADLVDDPTLAR